VIKAAICLLAMFAGGPVIALIPKAVLGGILIYIGIGMLKTWLFDSRTRLTTSDYVAVLLMVCLTVAVGYLPAVVVGIVVCCFDFAISSARLVTVRRSFSRNAWPDKVERSASESAMLEARGEGVRIVELQGALFFGSIRTLAYDIEKLLDEQQGLELLVIDFRRVPWIDSSGAQAMSRVVKLAGKHPVKLSLSGVTAPVLKMLQTNGCFSAQGPEVSQDIDHALLDWDDQTIRGGAHSPTPLEDWLTTELGSAELVQCLRSHLDEIQLTPGDVLFSQGEAADTLYLVQKGRLSAWLDINQTRYKVRSIQAGGTVGEMGLYRGADRSATVGADEPATVLALTKEALRNIELQEPTLAMELHKLFVRLLARRLDHANAQARALSS
jgi:SulP family sulfate permease